MAIFIDTGIFVAARNKSESINRSAIQIIKEISNNNYGDFYTSDYIFDEAMILIGSRTKKYEPMRDIGQFILNMPNLKFVYTDQKVFKSAWKIHEKYNDRLLSFTDATIIAWCEQLHITNIATVDAHFDGILNMIKPSKDLHGM